MHVSKQREYDALLPLGTNRWSKPLSILVFVYLLSLYIHNGTTSVRLCSNLWFALVFTSEGVGEKTVPHGFSFFDFYGPGAFDTTETYTANELILDMTDWLAEEKADGDG